MVKTIRLVIRLVRFIFFGHSLVEILVIYLVLKDKINYSSTCTCLLLYLVLFYLLLYIFSFLLFVSMSFIISTSSFYIHIFSSPYVFKLIKFFRVRNLLSRKCPNFSTLRMQVALSGGFHEASSSIQNGTRWVSEPRRQLIKISSIIRV